MSYSIKNIRKKYNFGIDNTVGIIETARRLFSEGKIEEATDIYEALSEIPGVNSIRILAELYDIFQSFKQKDRYSLYQKRIYNFNISQYDKVLDIGSGHMPFPLATHLADISITDHNFGRAGAPFKYIDGKPYYEFNVEDIPFNDKEFDFVYCSHVLEHTENPEKACSELIRIAKRGYIETPTKAKDIWLNTAKISNHKWAVDYINDTLTFTEYDKEEIEGLQNNILMDMHTSPVNEREKAFSVLIYLKPQIVNTMLLWEDKFKYKVNRIRTKTDNPNTKYFYDNLYQGRWKINNVDIPFEYEESGKLEFYRNLVSLPFFNSQGNLLDVGCGLGGLLASLPSDNKFEFYGIDFSTSAIKHIDKRIKGNFIEGDVHNLPYDANYFERVVCTETLEHVDNPQKVIKEIFRVLRPYGKLLITVPEENKDIKDKDWPGGISLHINKFNTSLLSRMIANSGFNIEYSNVVKNEIWLVAEKILNDTHSEISESNSIHASENKIRFLQVHTFYKTYLDKFYNKFSNLINFSFEDQINAIVNDGFSGIHIIAPHMKEIGYNSGLIIANNKYAQSRWLQEHSFEVEDSKDFFYNTLKLQIEEIRPDILYLSDPITFDSRFVRKLNYKPKLIFGWRAADIPAGTDWCEFDVILSGLSGVLQTALKLGAKHSEYFLPGFAGQISDSKKIDYSYDVSFCGSWTSGQHKKRNSFINSIAEYALIKKTLRIGLFISGNESDFPNAVRQLNQGPVFGNEMYEVLKESKIVIDSRGQIRYRGDVDIDLAMNETMNMRIFETTGCGAFLLTEYHDNLNNLFSIGKEIETFKDEKELIDKIEYYLEHEEERKEIAVAGQQKCLSAYSMKEATNAFDILIRKHLRNSDITNDKKTDTNCRKEDPASMFKEAAHLINSKKFREGFNILNKLKSRRVIHENVDLFRAICFLNLNDVNSARQSLLEELSFFPENLTAKNLLKNLKLDSQLAVDDPEFFEIVNAIESYTMLSRYRLYSLFRLSKYICEKDIPGNFVECGVARGGSSALLAYVIKKYSKRTRYLYSFDSFEGMPEPSSEDIHINSTAEETGWGTGTCAAPVSSLINVASLLNAAGFIKPVKGFFNETLPKYKREIGDIALLHLDGDWYESTKTVLDNLFDQIAENGIVQVDDYGFWRGCKKALHEFEHYKNIKINLNTIDDTGVWFVKENYLNSNHTSLHNSLKLLNLGCGTHFHPDWINVDFNSKNSKVLKYDLSKGIPFEDNSFNVIYHSHLLEHFPKSYAPKFLKECYRILKQGGIIRVVIPNLEEIVKLYTILLEKSLSGDIEAQAKYDWIMLELFDQTVRNYSGGEMLKYWQQSEIPAKQFVLERMGSEASSVIDSIKEKSYSTDVNLKDFDSSSVGKFRLSGEIHQWMYDRYSLGKLLKKAGFKDINVCSASESRIPEFNKYYLDIDPDSSVRKPDSLFMEGSK